MIWKMIMITPARPTPGSCPCQHHGGLAPAAARTVPGAEESGKNEKGLQPNPHVSFSVALM